ncbi:MAG: stage III sporulation protein AD [Defluviitaleaceae bacterium]|nr:stage III sporulation protein AD [Defluviitaleaceae bacterium]
MTIIQVVAVGVLSAVLALTVKKQSPEIALMITIAASVLILFMLMPLLIGAVGVIQNLGGQLDTGIPYVSLVLQILGIAYIAELGAQVCSDAGESAIASKIELAGKIMIMAVAAPVLLDVLHMIVGIMP